MADVTNPPAFPSEHPFDWQRSGMDLRDYYVGRIVSALICAPQGSVLSRLVDANAENSNIGRALAFIAGLLADAMLAERAKGGAE